MSLELSTAAAVAPALERAVLDWVFWVVCSVPVAVAVESLLAMEGERRPSAVRMAAKVPCICANAVSASLLSSTDSSCTW